MENCKDVIKQMRKRAKELRDDSRVSINQSIANIITAQELEEWADKLEAVSFSAGEA